MVSHVLFNRLLGKSPFFRRERLKFFTTLELIDQNVQVMQPIKFFQMVVIIPTQLCRNLYIASVENLYGSLCRKFYTTV